MPAPRNESSAPACAFSDGELLEVGRQLLLGQRGSEVELATEPDARRDIREELFDRGDADRLEHRLAVGVGQREVAHGAYASLLGQVLR